MADELLTTGEVAHVAEVSSTAVRLWAKAKLLPCQRTRRGLMLFSRSAVETFLAERERVNRNRRQMA